MFAERCGGRYHCVSHSHDMQITKKPVRDGLAREYGSRRLLHAADGLDTLGTQVLAHFATVFNNSHALYIGLKRPLGTNIGVTHTVTRPGTFSASFTLGHCYILMNDSHKGNLTQIKGDQRGRHELVYHMPASSARPGRRYYV